MTGRESQGGPGEPIVPGIRGPDSPPERGSRLGAAGLEPGPGDGKSAEGFDLKGVFPHNSASVRDRGQVLPKNNYRGIPVMYAVIVTGGKQYRVMKGEVLRVELLDVEPGNSVEIDNVLLLGDGEKITVGTPNIAGAKVTATVKSHGRLDKIRIVKFRRRKHHRKQMGHRQHYSEIEITGIAG